MRLPEEWKRFEGKWLTLQLKNEEAIAAALEKQLAGFMESERTSRACSEKARTINTIITVVCFGIFFLCMAVLIYLFIARDVSGALTAA